MNNLGTLGTTLLKNDYVSASLSLFLALYAGLARPQLPAFIADLFENALFKILILTLVVYISSKNLQLALMIAVAFTITMNLLNEQRIAEGFISGIKEGMLTE
jgi:type IV secretory pathway VirB3-like protein